jgi:hypothetical protein
MKSTLGRGIGSAVVATAASTQTSEQAKASVRVVAVRAIAVRVIAWCG